MSLEIQFCQIELFSQTFIGNKNDQKTMNIEQIALVPFVTNGD